MPFSRGRFSVAALVLVLFAACTAAPSPSASGAVASPSPAGPSTSAAGSPSGSPAPSSSAAPSASEAPSVTTYTVVAGDTLYSIARRFATSVEQLQAWNAARYPGLAEDPGRLEAGWELIVAGEPNVTPLPTPTAAPATPTPPPVASGCRAGNRVAAGSAQTFYTIPNAGPALALTLDMGGRLDPALDILDFLIANKVCTTFFPTGAMSQTDAGRQVLAVIKAHPELFEVGNHTMYHCDLVRGGGGSPTTAPCDIGGPPSADFIRRELTDAEAIIRAATGQNPQPYWRAPYGSISDSVLAAAASVGYTKTLMWDIDTIDWKPINDGGPTAEQIASKVIGRAVNGSVVLMHLGGYETLDALKLMVPGLRDRGFLLTSVSDLLN